MAFDKSRPIDNDRYASGTPALRADKIDGNATVITVRDITEVEVDDPDRPGGKRYVLKLDSEEYPEHGYFLNTTGRRIIVEKYGPIPSKWIAKRIPLQKGKVFNPKARAMQDQLIVAPAGEWDEMLEAWDVENAPAKRRGAKKKTRR